MSGLQDRVQDTKERFQDWMADRKDAKGGSGRLIVWLVVLYLLVALVVGMFWSQEPDTFNVQATANARAEEMGVQPVRGFTTTATLMQITETMLYKPGGYL